MLGIIGGSGVYSVAKRVDMRNVITPYGVSVVEKIRFPSKKYAWFVARHGQGHFIPPHRVNYRANIYALKKLGVTAVLSTHAVGVISKYKVGDLILLDDFIGLQMGDTFYSTFLRGLRHIPMCEPYDKKLSGLVYDVAKAKGVRIKKGGVVFTTNGPRFETRAEIKAIKKLGANLVSMTASHEAILVNELEIPLVSIAIGTNYACGLKHSNPDAEEVLDIVSKSKTKISSILNLLVSKI